MHPMVGTKIFYIRCRLLTQQMGRPRYFDISARYRLSEQVCSHCQWIVEKCSPTCIKPYCKIKC